MDKVYHFVVGALIYACTGWIHAVGAMLLVIFVAVGKEAFDYLHREKHTPEVLDALATIAGGITAGICIKL